MFVFFSCSDCPYCMSITISECVSGMCISECFSLRVDQSLTKTNEKKSQWMCVLNVFHDCTRLFQRTPEYYCGVFVFDILRRCLCVFWMSVWSTASCLLFLWVKPSFNVTVKLGANCDRADAFSGHSGAFTIWPNHIVKRKAKYDHNLSPPCFSQPFYTSPTHAYINHLSLQISVFLNMLILINAWSH